MSWEQLKVISAPVAFLLVTFVRVVISSETMSGSSDEPNPRHRHIMICEALLILLHS